MNDQINATDPGPGSDRAWDAIVIGGGQTGLMMGYHLARQKMRYIILDEQQRIGDGWRTRWDSLRLFTPAGFDGLPGTPFPGDKYAFPTKDEMADYLEAYATTHSLPVETGVHVDAVHRDGDMFAVTAGDRMWLARRVIVATGGERTPRVPDVAARLAASVVQLHSSDYRNPSQLQPGAVLVVGVGNSGAEIAREVSRSHPTIIAGTPRGELPIRHGGAAARFAFPLVRLLGLYVLTLDTPMGRRALPKLSEHGDPLIRTKMRDLTAVGVTAVGRVTDVDDGMPVVEGGQRLDVANVIWCTGFRADFGWIDAPAFDEHGRFRQWRGVVADVPGLYVLGQSGQYSLASNNLTGTVRDAAYLAKRIAGDSAGAASAGTRRTAQPANVTR